MFFSLPNQTRHRIDMNQLTSNKTLMALPVSSVLFVCHFRLNG